MKIFHTQFQCELCHETWLLVSDGSESYEFERTLVMAEFQNHLAEHSIQLHYKEAANGFWAE